MLQRTPRRVRTLAQAAEREPAGPALAAGSAVLVAVLTVSAAIPMHEQALRFGVLAVAVFAVSCAVGHLRAAAYLAVCAYLLFDGFLVNQEGELTWHGERDATRVGVLLAAAVLGWAASRRASTSP